MLLMVAAFYRGPPKSISRTRGVSFDDLIGEREQIVGNFDAERLGRPEIDHRLEFGRLQHREVGGFRAFENPRGVDPILPIRIGDTYAASKSDPTKSTAPKRRPRRGSVQEWPLVWNYAEMSFLDSRKRRRKNTYVAVA
jgi:hypothetical protein